MTEPAELPPLSAMDTAGRASRVRRALSAAGAESLVVTKPANIRWLTGFTGSNGILALTPDRLVLVTDGRYRIQAAEQLETAGVEATIEITRTDVGPILDRALGAGPVALEAHHVTWQRRDQLADWLAARSLVATVGLIEEQRKDKDAGEISRLTRAAAIADVALGAVQGELGGSPTERQVARMLDTTMLELGADEPSYDTIVASGPNSALPHARPTDRVIEPDDLVVIDVGARLDGYGSDMTRTFVAGGEPNDEHRRLYRAVEEAQQAGVDAVRAGIEARAVDEVCRAVLAEHDLAEAFVHGAGHGIGLEIHEDPILSATTDGILRAGFVVTVEPGVYLPTVGGVRIEDSVIVDEQGCRAITHSPKSLLP